MTKQITNNKEFPFQASLWKGLILGFIDLEEWCSKGNHNDFLILKRLQNKKNTQLEFNAQFQPL